MQKKEYILGEGGGEALCGGALGPEVVVETLVLFLLPTGWPGRRLTGADDEDTTAGSLDLFFREGGRNLAFPSAHRCSDAIHLHRPWRQVLEEKP
jgi:hypothetical protein